MKSLVGISRTVTKVATLALAMRLMAPLGVVCQLSDHREVSSEEAEHHHSDAGHEHQHDSGVGHHTHAEPGQEAPEHPCHDTDGNCACSLTFLPEVQPSRAAESIELRASTESVALMPGVMALVPDFVVHCHVHEVFHPPRSIGVEYADPTRGPPSIV